MTINAREESIKGIKQKKLDKLSSFWYLGRESNPHSFNRNRILSPACLPVPPPRQLSERRDSNSRPQPWQGCALPTELLSLEVLQIYVEKIKNEIFDVVYISILCKKLNLCKLIFT